MATIVITGAASGIGLALTQHHLNQGHRVIASVRQPTDAIQNTQAEVITGVDVCQPSTLSSLKNHIGNTAIDCLINCAGVLMSETLEDLSFDSINLQWQVNTLGPLQVTHALLNNLQSGSKVAMISSRMGSIEDNGSGGYYGYRMSKAALNAASKSLAHDLKPKGIAVAILHPGLVATKMVGNQGNVSPEEAAQGLMDRIDELTLDNTGTFWHANGEILPW